MTAQITIRSSVEAAAQRFEQAGLFYGHGTDNAEDEALSLILYALDLDYSITDDDLDQVLGQQALTKIDQIITQRIQTRKPAPYLTHRTWFMGMEFYVDERVLVPRSPLAELIYHQCQPWVEPEQVKTVLDLCTGSGCIAIACATVFKQASVIASDLSNAALEVCRHNISLHKLEQRVQAVRSDLFANLGDRKFDLIITNPPYVPDEARSRLPQEYLHEPEIGLYSGNTGLDIPLQILQQAPDFLTQHGALIMEVGESQQRLAQAVPNLELSWLDFEFGGEGVCAIKRPDLVSSRG